MFCTEHEVSLSNTWSEHHPRRLYTWISPDGETRNQIDYIAIAQKWKGSIQNCKTLPGADCDSDHQLLVAKLKIKLKKIKTHTSPRKLNIENLKGLKAIEYAIEVKNRFEGLETETEERTPEDLWETTKKILLERAQETIGYRERQKKKTWITDSMYVLIKAKREAKMRDREKYKDFKKEVQKKVRIDKQKQIEEICEELEQQNRTGNMKKVYQTVKTLTGKFSPQMFGIKAISEEMITDK